MDVHPDPDPDYGAGYTDITTNKSASLRTSERTALRALNKFLMELHNANPTLHPHSSLETLTTQELLTFGPIFGRFPDYLMKTQKVKEKTALHYISQARKQIGDKCPESNVFLVEWYKTLRKQTGKIFTEKCRQDNTKKTNSAPPMSSADLEDLCNLLFLRMQYHLDEQARLLQAIYTKLTGSDPTDVGAAAEDASPLQPAQARQTHTIRGHFQRLLPPSYVASSPRFPIALTISLQNVTLSCAFFKWYNEELFNCETTTYKEQKVRRKLAYAVQVMKKLLPSAAVIAPKPSEVAEFQVWATELQRLADIGQQKVFDLCNAARADQIVSGSRKRKRELSHNVEAMIKRIGNLARSQPERFAAACSARDTGAVDNANPEEPDIPLTADDSMLE
jgi:hypothetical protein